MTITTLTIGATTGDEGADAPAPLSAGWYEDPEGLHRMRYFSGSNWTTHVTHFGPTPCAGCRPH